MLVSFFATINILVFVLAINNNIVILLKSSLEDTTLANHPSAIKRHKQSLKKASKNRTIKTRIKNVVKAVRLAIQGKNKEEALLALNTAKTVIDKAGGKKILHWKNAARKVSRLSKAVSALEV